MALFTVDPEKCNRDGICVASCPFSLIEMNPRMPFLPLSILPRSDV